MVLNMKSRIYADKSRSIPRAKSYVHESSRAFAMLMFKLALINLRSTRKAGVIDFRPFCLLFT